MIRTFQNGREHSTICTSLFCFATATHKISAFRSRTFVVKHRFVNHTLQRSRVKCTAHVALLLIPGFPCVKHRTMMRHYLFRAQSGGLSMHRIGSLVDTGRAAFRVAHRISTVHYFLMTTFITNDLATTSGCTVDDLTKEKATGCLYEREKVTTI